MPKFLELYDWRFFVVMFDLLNEPFHIHVTDKGRKECKYWVMPLSYPRLELAFHRGFTRYELRKIEKAIITHLAHIIDKYQMHCYENGIEPEYKTFN